MAGAEAEEGNLIAPHGFYRLKVKSGKEHLLPDLVFGLSSEFYRVQMRALATGSDGLAEIQMDDLGMILFPMLNEQSIKYEVQNHVHRLGEERVSFRATISDAIENIFGDLDVQPRKSNFSQV